MQRITITIDDDLLQAVDGLMSRRGYGSRSEAMRDIIREMVDRDRLAEPDADCVGALTFVYDHETRALARRGGDRLSLHPGRPGRPRRSVLGPLGADRRLLRRLHLPLDPVGEGPDRRPRAGDLLPAAADRRRALADRRRE